MSLTGKLLSVADKPLPALLASVTTSGVAAVLDWALRVTGSASPVAALTMIAGCVTACCIAIRTLVVFARDAHDWLAARRKSQTSQAVRLPSKWRKGKR